MSNIDRILPMLSWNNTARTQKRGLRLGRQIKCLKPFFQPISDCYGKDIWENCASIICERSDKELQYYLHDMLCWIQDMNWPGADIIQRRLINFSDTDNLANEIAFIVPHLAKEEDYVWIENLAVLLQNESIKGSLSTDTIALLVNQRTHE